MNNILYSKQFLLSIEKLPLYQKKIENLLYILMYLNHLIKIPLSKNNAKKYNFDMRNISTPATILNTKQSGENNKTITLLTPSYGITYSTLYGGPKSKLRSLVSPFNSGTIYLYNDDSKQSSKITDFDVKKYHPSFSENLFKTYSASLGAEILIKTKCGGSFEQAFYLYNGLLDGMELSDEKNSRLGLIRFIWRYIGVLGIKPDTKYCCMCGKSFLTRNNRENQLKCYGTYSEGDNGFICNDCFTENQQSFILSQDSLTYLEAVSVLRPKEVREIAITTSCLKELKDFCYYLIQNACNAKLLTLESGISIL